MQEPDCVDIEVFVGVDIAKGDHYACVVTSAGAEVLARSVRNDEAAIGRLIDDAAVHGTVALVIDTTSSAASLLLEAAAQREVPVAYVTGLAMRRAADLYAGAAKTDPKDAAVLADYARRNADRLSWTTPSDELLVRLRILNGRDADLAADATRAANRLRDALLTVSPALERAVGDKLSSSGGARDALARWGTPTALRDAGKARVRTRIAKRSPRTAQRLTDAIWGALDAQSVTVTAEATWCDTITELAADLDRICERRDQLATTIEDAFMDHPLGKVLASLCGFGPRTGARTLAEIGDPNRFADGGRLAAYAGLAPVDWQSGRSATVPRKPRGGNHRLKNAMFTAAFVATQHDPDARAYYQRKRSEGKRHNAAVICVARRRCNIILAMLKTQTPYHYGNRHNLRTCPRPVSGLTTRQGHLPLS